MTRAALLTAPVILLALAPVLPLAGQDRTVQVDIAQEGEDDNAFPWPDFLDFRQLPGEYRTTMTIEGFEIMGQDGEKDGLESLFDDSEPEVTTYCLAQEPEPVDWVEDFGDGDCTQTSLSVDGGEFSMTMQCADETGPGEMTMRMTGSATPSGMDLLMRMQMQDEMMGKMRMTMRVDLERIGDC